MAAHEQSNHHTGNLTVGYRRSIFVRTVHYVPDHVSFSLPGVDGPGLPPLPYNIHVDLSHLALSSLAFAIVWKRQPAKLEIDRNEPAVKIVKRLRETSIKLFANFLALQRVGCSVDGELGESRGDVERSPVTNKTLRRGVFGEERTSFGFDELNVGAKGRRNQSELDEISIQSACLFVFIAK
jgi:hypothetical protein